MLAYEVAAIRSHRHALFNHADHLAVVSELPARESRTFLPNAREERTVRTPVFEVPTLPTGIWRRSVPSAVLTWIT